MRSRRAMTRRSICLSTWLASCSTFTAGACQQNDDQMGGVLLHPRILERQDLPSHDASRRHGAVFTRKPISIVSLPSARSSSVLKASGKRT